MGSKVCIAAVAIMVTVVIALSGYFVGANADQDTAISKKVENKEFKEFKYIQEKEHDKIDAKFDRVIDQMALTNVRLGEIATKLEERTR
jgi:hypothetical protein